jgi:hypothetical protein
MVDDLPIPLRRRAGLPNNHLDRLDAHRNRVAVWAGQLNFRFLTEFARIARFQNKPSPLGIFVCLQPLQRLGFPFDFGKFDCLIKVVIRPVRLFCAAAPPHPHCISIDSGKSCRVLTRISEPDQPTYLFTERIAKFVTVWGLTGPQPLHLPLYTLFPSRVSDGFDGFRAVFHPFALPLSTNRHCAATSGLTRRLRDGGGRFLFTDWSLPHRAIPFESRRIRQTLIFQQVAVAAVQLSRVNIALLRRLVVPFAHLLCTMRTESEAILASVPCARPHHRLIVQASFLRRVHAVVILFGPNPVT